MRASATVSVRTCIGCKQRGPASGMARLVLEEARVVACAPTGRRPAGRGASLHAEAACVQAAVKAGAFARAFRQRVSGIDAGELLQQVRRALALAERVQP